MRNWNLSLQSLSKGKMVSCYLCDNAVTAIGSLSHSSSEYGAKQSIFIAMDISAKRILNEKDVRSLSLGVKDLNTEKLVTYAQRKKNSKFFELFKIFHNPVTFYKNYIRCKKILKELKIDVVYASTDRSYGNGYILPFIKAALQSDIKVVILDFADPADEERLLRSRLNSNKVWQPNFLSKLLFKNWILSGADGHELLMYPASQLLTWWIFGTKSQNPKFIGHLNGVAVEVKSPATFERLRASGVKNISLLNNYMLSGASVECAEPVYDIALAFPQLSEHNLCSQDKSKEIQIDLIRCLQSSGLNFVILLHPKMDKEYYLQFLNDYNVQVFEGSSYSAIKLSRGFLSIYSSLTHEAITCGKWAHVYDPLDFNYKMFECYPALETSKSIDVLSHALDIFRSQYVEKC
jgi:hypothetical protein